LKEAVTLDAADMSNKKTFGAPHNARSLDDLLRDFRKAREYFVKRLIEMDEVQLAHTAFHPGLQKPMRLADMVFFVAEHDDHHLTLIRRILEDDESGLTKL
jgi:hypothetical protein